MLTYSIAIRTLGKSGDVFRRELEDIAAQTVQPDKVLIYIAAGCMRPDFQVGKEEYVWVKKGMVAQRILPYDEITSDVILMLDDDVELQPDSAERMLKAMEEHSADCIGADTFRNQDLSFSAKIYVAATNSVFPHWSGKWAFKIRYHGSFSYNNHPTKSFYRSQSCAGNAMMWRMDSYRRLHLEDELWLDELPFAYGEDMVESYKVHKNGLRLGVVYDSGCRHLDAGSSSGSFRKNPDRIRVRTMAAFIIWWRTIYSTMQCCTVVKSYSALSFFVKCLWQFMTVSILSVVRFSPRYVVLFLRGMCDGWKFVHTDKFRLLRNYVLR